MIPQDAIRQRVALDMRPFRATDGALRVLLVYKKSRLEVYASEYPDLPINELIRKGDNSLNFLKDEHEQHFKCLEQVKKDLAGRGVDLLVCNRADLSSEKTQGRIIVTVGGDGTILDASHFAQDNPIFGVNSDPERSVGSLCLATQKDFADLFDALLSGTLLVLPVARIGGTLDGKELPILALNEVLVAHSNPAAMSRYVIEVNGQKEEHKSSGVWIAAAMGSTGATLSAGGQVQPLGDSRIQLVVREPYFSIGKVNRMLAGFLRQDEVLRLTSRMPAGQIFIDGPHCFEKFEMGSVLELHSRAMPLFLFVTDDMEYRRAQISRLRETIHEEFLKEHPEFVV